MWDSPTPEEIQRIVNLIHTSDEADGADADVVDRMAAILTTPPADLTATPPATPLQGETRPRDDAFAELRALAQSLFGQAGMTKDADYADLCRSMGSIIYKNVAVLFGDRASLMVKNVALTARLRRIEEIGRAWEERPFSAVTEERDHARWAIRQMTEEAGRA